jgi:hypothetical protein
VIFEGLDRSSSVLRLQIAAQLSVDDMESILLSVSGRALIPVKASEGFLECSQR